MILKRLILAMALFLPIALNAQEASNAALAFTRIDRNPRTSAFAGAGLASTGASAWSAVADAAQISFLNGLGDAALGVQLWQPTNEVDKTTNFGGGAAFRFGSFGAALAGAYQMGVPIGGYTPNDLLISLGLSYNILEVVSVGLNARYATQHLAQNAQVNGFCADLSVIGRILPQLTAALSVGNLGPKVKASEASFGQPAYLKLAAAWNQALAEKHTLEILLDGEYNFGNAAAGALGLEYNYGRIVFVRAGYRLAGEKALIPSHLAFGIGAQFAGFRADFSFLTASRLLGNTLNIGLGYSF